MKVKTTLLKRFDNNEMLQEHCSNFSLISCACWDIGLMWLIRVNTECRKPKILKNISGH